MSSTRPLIISKEKLKEIVNLPSDFKIVRGGPTGRMGEMDGIFAEIESEEFKVGDCGKPIELKD